MPGIGQRKSGVRYRDSSLYWFHLICRRNGRVTELRQDNQPEAVVLQKAGREIKYNEVHSDS